MKFTSQGIKELLDSGSDLIFYDNHPVEELKYLVEVALENKRHITIIARTKGVQDLKKVISSADGNLTIQLDHSI